jgi:catechol 2,3-dioxygenase-like lactoylglutathione lyase family enzyme
MDMKLEVMVVPASDVERAKRFYQDLGWRLDADIDRGANFHVVQLTPPGSAASIHLGKGHTTAKPGSLPPPMLVVKDIEAARTELVGHGVAVSDIFHAMPGTAPEPGPEPAHASYQSYATFKDSEGNGWILQEVRERLPGR